ncbi:MAG: hypothetical protein GW856_06065, partial [Cyanobacteria bacterium]|nr:hypothetical protein [Cyanobacteria bacterium CG_2015-16_32_12]
LIIFDDLQNIFSKNQFCGEYKTEYQEYENFFKTIAEIEHQSHIILISQEKCPTMQSFNSNSSDCIELSGLYSLEIIKNLGKYNHQEWLKLINLYEGNINYIQDIRILIKDIFNGDVKEFLAEENIVITPNIKLTLDNIFNRLCDAEKKIINEFVKYEKPMTRQDLKRNLDLSAIDFINGLNSLINRYLITKIEQNKTLFQLSPVFREYVKTKTISI